VVHISFCFKQLC